MDEKQAVEIAKTIARLKQLEPAMAELLPLQASQLFRKFSSLVRAGFTPEQALELCKGPLIH